MVVVVPMAAVTAQVFRASQERVGTYSWSPDCSGVSPMRVAPEIL